ncbi:MAG: hypothetical protein KAU01_04065 [Candidatus Cloacimonetes bacterium]|nr:hypothetical protein [Candidatus Cloacimonadota bacterium]
MAEKILSLKLTYKDKVLDFARYKRDFKNKFFIGSDKHLFWQILDKAFPGKYALLSKRGSIFKIKLRPGMDVSIKKDNQVLTKEELQRANLLRGDSLTLDPTTEGSITFGGNWKIGYSFITPYKYAPTREELTISKEFAKFSPLAPQEKFTRIFIVLGIVVTWIGLYIAESFYVPPVEIDFTERLLRIEDFATQIVVGVTEEAVETGVGKTREELEEEVIEQVEQAQAMSSAEFEQEFGLSLGAGVTGMPGGEGTEDFSSELLEVTKVSEIVAAGPGTGAGPAVTRGATALDVAGSGGFDLEGVGDGLGDLGGLEGLDLGGTGGFEEVDLASLGGDVGSYNITKVESKAQFQAVKRRFAGIRMVKEGTIKIEEMTPEAKTELANIDQIVSTYKPQIAKLFTVESLIMDMYGTIEFSLIIGGTGKVEAVDIDVTGGSYFTDTFLAKCRQIIMNWKIKVKEPIVYSFRMKFYK